MVLKRRYRLQLQSNNADIVISEALDTDNLDAAVSQAKTTLTDINSTQGIPHDFRIKSLMFEREIESQ
jgi:hypothetical protein